MKAYGRTEVYLRVFLSWAVCGHMCLDSRLRKPKCIQLLYFIIIVICKWGTVSGSRDGVKKLGAIRIELEVTHENG
jgi:hypothetical protein